MSIDTKGLEWAVKFHELYEHLAPGYGYETRTETRQFESESKNGRLMIAVCGELIPQAEAAAYASGFAAGAAAQRAADAGAVCGLCKINRKQPDVMAVGQTSVSKAYIPGGEPDWFRVHDVIYSSGVGETLDCKAAAILAAPLSQPGAEAVETKG